jgi:acetolactate synthase-1/2/3 large subunit
MLITTAHEQGATHAAEGYACITRGVGVCIVTSGPGVTNATTGINDAYKDSVPLVVITGDVPTNQSGHNGFQEVNTIETTKSMTKDNFIVKDIKYLADTIRKAFKIALE